MLEHSDFPYISVPLVNTSLEPSQELFIDFAIKVFFSGFFTLRPAFVAFLFDVYIYDELYLWNI